MNKKIHKKNTELKKFLTIDEIVKKTNLPKIIKANPFKSAKKSINKIYQDYKKTKERKELKKQKQIELDKQKLIKEEKRKKIELKRLKIEQQKIKDE